MQDGAILDTCILKGCVVAKVLTTEQHSLLFRGYGHALLDHLLQDFDRDGWFDIELELPSTGSANGDFHLK